ncbi:MAG: ABC transporter substrate-binding protein [Alphaproteobacteria bacterium]|nr:ABC transporter substrate-binding protein [Alphaproteobacteria bacterium]
MRRGLAALATLAALAVTTPVVAASEGPRRIVSLNLCADQLVLRLADRDRIAAVTWLARDPELSIMAEAARTVPITRGGGEHVVSLAPDLVVAGVHTTRITVGFLKRLGYRVLDLDLPVTLDAVRAQIRLVAEALGRPVCGEALIAEMDRSLAAIPAGRVGARANVAVWQPNGFTVGTDTLIDTVIRAAGLDNFAARRGIAHYARLDLETLILGRPDFLVVNRADEGPAALATEMLRHRAIDAAIAATRRIVVPTRLWVCGGPETAEAIALLAAATADGPRRSP